MSKKKRKLRGTVEKVIPRSCPKENEKVQIGVHEAGKFEIGNESILAVEAQERAAPRERLRDSVRGHNADAGKTQR